MIANKPAPRPDDTVDADLLGRVGAGDRQAFQELYLKYHQPLLRFIYRVTGQLESAQEGVNDVMLVVWQKARAFSGQSKVSTWMFGIAYRKALKLRFGARRWVERFKAAPYEDIREPSTLIGEPRRQTEHDQLLAYALQSLPVKQRVVVELTYFYGYSYEEIAAIVDCPLNTVKTRMFHARARLRRLVPSFTGGGA